MKLKLLRLALLPLLFSSCLAFGIPYTSNPTELLNYAEDMLRQNRPKNAKKFLDKAIEEYQKAGDKKGEAEAEYVLGIYYKTNFYTPPESGVAYIPQALKYSSNVDYAQSEATLKRALEIFKSLDDHEAVARGSFGLAMLYELQRNKQKAMEQYDISEQAYLDMKKQDPNAEVHMVNEYDDWLQLLEKYRKS